MKVRVNRKKMIYTLYSLGLLVLIVFIFILQPSLPNEKDPGPKNPPNEVVKIWGWDDSITDSFEIFYQNHPNITLEFIPTKTRSYVEKIKLTLATNNDIPDICLLENDYRGQLMTLDIWENLESNPYNLHSDEILDYILPNITNTKGEIIAVPYDVAIAGMAYRRTLTQKFFGTDDEKQLHTLFHDWNALIEKGMEVKRKQENDVFLFASLADAGVILLNQTKEPYILNKKLNHPEGFLQSFHILAQLRDERLVDVLKQWSPPWYNSFTEPRYFFYPCATWFIQYAMLASSHENEWGLMIPPDGGFSWGGTAWSIPKTSQHKDAAWSYIKWFLLSEEGAFFNKENLSGVFTHCKEAYENPIYTSMYNKCFGKQDIGQLFFQDIFPSVQVRPIGKYDRVVNDVFLLMTITLMENPTMTAEEAMTIFTNELHNRIPELKFDLIND